MSTDAENRDQTVASMYLGVDVSFVDVDWALELERQELIASAFESAAEVVRSALANTPRFRVEVIV